MENLPANSFTDARGHLVDVSVIMVVRVNGGKVYKYSGESTLSRLFIVYNQMGEGPAFEYGCRKTDKNTYSKLASL